MNIDRAQAPHPQHLHFQVAIDPIAVEGTDQVIDAIDIDTVEAHDDVARQQPGLRRRPVRFDLREQRPHLVLDAGEHRMPSGYRRTLAGYTNISAPHIAVADDLRQHELRGVAGNRKADTLPT